MKKLFLLFALVGLCAVGTAQISLFKPIPKDYYKTVSNTTKEAVISSFWAPRLNVGVTGTSYGYNPETKQIEIVPFGAVGFGLGYLHYKEADGVPFNDFGFNLLYLQLTNHAGSGLGVYGTYNTGQIGLFNLGGHYDFAINKFLFDLGLTFNY